MVLPFSHKDSALAAEMLRWHRELCGKIDNRHRLLLLGSKGMDRALMDEVNSEAHAAFENVRFIIPATPNERGWPESANHLFRTAVKYNAAHDKSPFFWLEPDCTPLAGNWIDQLELAYNAAGKPYMGFRRDIPIPHISGPAVYPWEVEKYNPRSLRTIAIKSGYAPFDVIDGHKTLQHAEVTPLIFHDWGTKEQPPTFPNAESIKRIPKEAALFHRCKDGTLISRLRERNKSFFKSSVEFVKRLLPKRKAVAVVQLGRYGDIINILPICKHLADSGKKVDLIVSKDFASICDGISYVTPVVVPTSFHKLNEALAMASTQYDEVVRCQVYGENFQQYQFAPTYNQEEWREAGFWTHFNDPTWRPVFDRRSKEREDALRKKLYKTGKPKIITNLTSALTAPFKNGAQVDAALRSALPEYEFVEVGKVRAERIYDLLGLVEDAALVVTIDTATLHLAAASSTPVFALINHAHWLGSSVRYNCLGQLKYDQAHPEAVVSGVKKALLGKLTENQLKVLASPIKSGKRLNLPEVGLWACCFSTDIDMLRRTLRVLRFCCTKFAFKKAVFLSYLPLPVTLGFPVTVVQIPKIEWEQWNNFHTRVVPKYLEGADFWMSVHEDGFPTNPELWKPEFLNYDFIGAAWIDGVVGNAGFCIESERFLQTKMTVPFGNEPTIPSDTFLCRTHRAYLESKGMAFAPLELAMDFSVEQRGKAFPSFGFHGRRDVPQRYKDGWNLIEESEE